MSSNLNRKEAIREYKMRKVSRGVFAVRCMTTGQIWIDSSPNLDGAKNGLWFQLREGLHRDKSLQTEWNTHGENLFQLEVLETLDDDVIPLGVKDLLKEKKSKWTAQLGAKAL
jgi:hypothetical protein